ncbi:MAG TPA: CRISPR-associated endonuclease Cas6 [Bacteroidaceae bacterium]|jgi:hypothetical protein|nr:CRISPR-associated endonuclease Cas6 [Bacteroidales bacterium]HPX99210.1 CRISPR-associated endonuclease Cas6 [Bacteroidaceae bacterium]
MNQTKIITIRFKNSISSTDIEAFRGAVINALQDKDILFHNHNLQDKGFRYSYPLIQYKRINKKAAIFCLEDGTESIGKFFLDSDMILNLNGEVYKFEVESVKAYNHLIQVWNSNFRYTIRKWLALNQENYELYNKLESVAEKSAFLENILKANILSLAKGLDIFFEKQVECKITRLSEPRITRYKNVKMTMFDAEFLTNVSIPDYAGLGKGVSVGYGMAVRKKDKKEQ